MSTISVSESLKSITHNKEILNFINENKDQWVTFGKKNSHILRTVLFKMFQEANLSKEAVFLIYFFHSLIKDKDRILLTVDRLPDEIKKNSDVAEAIKFMKTKMVKFVKDEAAGKFASLHLPSTNPGLDLLCFVLAQGQMKEDEAKKRVDGLYEEFVGRNTTAQIALNNSCQELNKTKVKKFWDDVVLIADAEERKKNKLPVGFQEKFYDTSSSDKYSLIGYDFVEIAVPSSGYSDVDLKKYIFGILTYEERKKSVSAAVEKEKKKKEEEAKKAKATSQQKDKGKAAEGQASEDEDEDEEEDEQDVYN